MGSKPKRQAQDCRLSLSSFPSSPLLRDDCGGGAVPPWLWRAAGGRGETLFIIQPAEITPSSFSRGQICAILKKKSYDLLTALNG